MNWQKRTLALMLALMLSLTACGGSAEASEGSEAPTTRFVDIPADASYDEAVAWCAENGLMNGVESDRFNPYGTLDRAMLATVLYRAEGEPDVDGAPAFTDTQLDVWYSDAVVWANREGLLKGYGNGLFGTTDAVSKEALNVVVDRYMGRGDTWVGNPDQAAPATRMEVAMALFENLNGQAKPDDKAQTVISEITVLEPGLSSASFTGDDGFENFLSQGGASSDAKVAQFLSDRLKTDIDFRSQGFGCSAFVSKTADGGTLFGRNFDWYNCNALVVTSHPTAGYASISTVNLGFLDLVTGKLDGNAQVLAALYAPLDGMNEKGLAVSVNMIQDNTAINQSTSKPDITTTTAVRLLLNKAADVDEAIDLLSQYDLHASFGMVIHFAIADRSGRGVAVEYVDGTMVVTETPVVTNFYLAEGSKHGIGTSQSHTRYDTLMQVLADHDAMTMEDVRDALNSVSKHNFHDGETTEWSAVFNLSTGEAHYYHREDYETRYTFSLD